MALDGGPSSNQVLYPFMQDEAGRPLVNIKLNGRVSAQAVMQALEGMSGVEVTSTDMDYRAGIIDAYIPATSLEAVAKTAGGAGDRTVWSGRNERRLGG